MGRPRRKVIRPVPGHDGPGRRGGRGAGPAVALSAVFPIAVWFFAGGFGLVLGLAIVIGWWTLAPSRRVVWGTAIGCMALAPVALALQGLPGSPVVGSLFGVQHMAAHRLVQTSMAIAVFAALAEVLGVQASTAVRGRIGRWGRALARPRDEEGAEPDATDPPSEP